MEKERWLVLSANNVSTNMGMSGPYDTKEAAEEAMQSEFRDCAMAAALSDDVVEKLFDEAMKDYTGLGLSYYDGDDLFCWSLQSIAF